MPDDEGPFDYDFGDVLPDGSTLEWPFAYCDGYVWRFDKAAETFLPEWVLEQ